MTRFLPLTRGGWPAEVLCEVTDLRDFPLCVKHTLLNGDVSVEMHMLDGGYSRDYECNYDLIPAPEPSVAAYEAARDAFQKDAEVQEHGWVLPMWVIGEMLRAAYAEDGITPQQQPGRVAELEAEVAKLLAERDEARKEVERMRAWKPSGAAAQAAWSARWHESARWGTVLLAGFRTDFPDPQPGTGEQA